MNQKRFLKGGGDPLFWLLKGTIKQEDIRILNLYSQDSRAATFTKSLLLAFKPQTYPNSTIAGEK